MKRADEIRSQQQWESGFDGHADAQLLRLSRLSFREKIKVIEGMQKIAAAMAASAPARIASVRPADRESRLT